MREMQGARKSMRVLARIRRPKKEQKQAIEAEAEQQTSDQG